MSKANLEDVVMPDLQGAEEIVIGAWVKRAGDHVDEGETIVEARTDKVNAEIPSTVTGTVAELLVKEGEQVTVGQAIAKVAPEEARNEGCRRRLWRHGRGRLVAAFQKRSGGRRVRPLLAAARPRLHTRRV